MLKKQLLTGLIIFIQAFGLLAQQSRFKENETFNVWAASGLDMRDKPDAKSAKVATIPYGAKVTVQPNIGIKIPFEVEEFKGFTVKGYWLLVKYGNSEGFVFDGFLSRLPAPDKNVSTNLEMYLNTEIGVISKKTDIRIFDKITHKRRIARPTDKFDEKDIIGFTQRYEYDIYYEHGKSSGGGDMVISSPNFSLFESYFLIKTFFITKPKILTFDEKNKYINVFGDKCDFNINQIYNEIVVDGYCEYLERH